MERRKITHLAQKLKGARDGDEKREPYATRCPDERDEKPK
jgi:hypothetical protein